MKFNILLSFSLRYFDFDDLIEFDFLLVAKFVWFEGNHLKLLSWLIFSRNVFNADKFKLIWCIVKERVNFD